MIIATRHNICNPVCLLCQHSSLIHTLIITNSQGSLVHNVLFGILHFAVSLILFHFIPLLDLLLSVALGNKLVDISSLDICLHPLSTLCTPAPCWSLIAVLRSGVRAVTCDWPSQEPGLRNYKLDAASLHHLRPAATVCRNPSIFCIFSTHWINNTLVSSRKIIATQLHIMLNFSKIHNTYRPNKS